MEIWKPLDENLKHNYSISNFGKVRVDTHYQKDLIGCYIGSLDTYGYRRVSLMNANNTQQDFKIHRLVVKYFSDEYYDSCTVNHKDFNKINNHIDNLECISLSENTMHYINSRKKNGTSSTVLGVGFHSQIRKWTARVNYKNKRFSIGTFSTESEAIKAIEEFNISEDKEILLKKGKGTYDRLKNPKVKK